MGHQCAGCGQPAIARTLGGEPICPDCWAEGYGDEEEIERIPARTTSQETDHAE